MLNVIMLSVVVLNVAFYLLLCWVSSGWMSLCLVSWRPTNISRASWHLGQVSLQQKARYLRQKCVFNEFHYVWRRQWLSTFCIFQLKIHNIGRGKHEYMRTLERTKKLFVLSKAVLLLWKPLSKVETSTQDFFLLVTANYNGYFPLFSLLEMIF